MPDEPIDYGEHKRLIDEMRKFSEGKKSLIRGQEEVRRQLGTLKDKYRQFLVEQRNWKLEVTRKEEELRSRERLLADKEETVAASGNAADTKIQAAGVQETKARKTEKEARQEKEEMENRLRAITKNEELLDKKLELLSQMEERAKEELEKVVSVRKFFEELVRDAQAVKGDAIKLKERVLEKGKQADKAKISAGMKAKWQERREEGFGDRERAIKDKESTLVRAEREVAQRSKSVDEAIHKKLEEHDFTSTSQAGESVVLKVDGQK